MHGPSLDDHDDIVAQINVIPFIDVVLVILIIFMVTTVFSKDSALKLDLPKGSKAQTVTQPPAEIVVSVDKGGVIYVNNKPTKLEDVQPTVKQYINRNRNTVLVLRGDKNVIYGDLMPVLDEVSRTGVKMTLAYKPGESQ